MILACNHISKAFIDKTILSDVTFHMEEREKVAIIGINGAGKSTLLRIIVGELAADEGDVVIQKGASLGYLAQHQELLSNRPIYEELMAVKQDILDLEIRMRNLEHSMKTAAGEELEAQLDTYSRISHQFEDAGGYAIRSEVTGVLKGLGFEESDFNKTVETLSGGQKTRVALGRLLLTRPDILLLDEPTNHLDMESIAWLEGFLSNYNGSIIIVAHDRYFLDRIVTKVVEIDHHHSYSFHGNYTAYSQKKKALMDARMKAWLNQQKEIAHQEEVIAKLRSFNREKSIKRAESREKMLDKIELVDKPPETDATMSIRLEPNILSGNDVLTIRDLKKSYGDLCLFSGVDIDIKRGERIAVIGNNGTGKTTLLKIINELVDADHGSITTGAKVHIGYYDQEHQVLHMEKTLFEEIQDQHPDMNNTQVRNILAAFLFTGDDVFKRIKELSGGERGRVSLALLMLSDANFLILDEPTNHLDMESREILENALVHYTGTILYVSHDRYFINQTATRILELTNQNFINYIGNYDYYLEKRDTLSAAAPVAAESEESSGIGKLNWTLQREQQARLRKRQNDLKKTEEMIEQAEMRNGEIEELLTQEDVYTNVSRLLELQKEKTALDEQLQSLYHTWEELAE